MKTSMIHAMVLGWIVALTPAPVHAQEPERDRDPAEALRQLRGLVEGVREEGVDRFTGRMTDEHGATLEWSFERADAEPDFK